MPSKNTVKEYVENGCYHVYNRGVEKRSIFLDERDCTVFLIYMKLYLSPLTDIQTGVFAGSVKTRFVMLNLSQEIKLLAFALMPNHFHLLLRQYTQHGVTKFMKRLTTSYVMYFNKRYERVGPLFQGVFKAAIVESDPYLLHLSRYIHLNSIKISGKINYSEFSSYPYYLQTKDARWIKPEEILSYFQVFKYKEDSNYSYRKFVESYAMKSNNQFNELLLEADCK